MNELTMEQKAALALESMTDCCGLLAELSGGMKQNACYDAYFVPETFWYNRVSLRPGASDPETLLGEIADGVKSGTLPPLLGWLDQDYADTELFPLLKRAGYVPIQQQKEMYLSLDGRVAKAAPPQVELMRPEEAEAWSDASARGFGKPPETGGMVLLADAGKADFLLWREGGEIIGGTMLACVNGNGGIHEVSTLPEHRGKGISSALVDRALDLAAEHGCSCATLQASELGVPVYSRLGFETVGIIHNWLLPPQKT